MEITALARRLQIDIGAGEIWLASAEDVILAKLKWFRKGGELSEKQWRDVLGILKVQGTNLDFTYLEQMTTRFHLADLLIRARDDTVKFKYAFRRPRPPIFLNKKSPASVFTPAGLEINPIQYR